MCHVSNQIANHCDEQEDLCPLCESIMYFGDYNIDTLVCTGCFHEVDVNGE